MSFKHLIGTLALGAAIAFPAMAENDPAVETRQGQFKLFIHNFGVMGAMAQGRIDYDAEMAQTAADNLFHVTRHDQSRLWPEGTDSMSIDGTRARPAIWDNLDDFAAKFGALQDATEALQGAAGDGLEAMQAAFGRTAGACQACHEVYREEAS
ncbi:c-type cytochrome [Natronohydrobacter thiooxidans]|jgi:cytochrome c556|uniref:c-type cytochrome n=1 Tax=Natronohydrobacter thiooxidans TaxID=87172 RepID=UPI0008FF1AB2|nr:cytochrome c [Natronohydrobacter thiooxidans]